MSLDLRFKNSDFDFECLNVTICAQTWAFLAILPSLSGPGEVNQIKTRYATVLLLFGKGVFFAVFLIEAQMHVNVNN